MKTNTLPFIKKCRAGTGKCQFFTGIVKIIVIGVVKLEMLTMIMHSRNKSWEIFQCCILKKMSSEERNEWIKLRATTLRAQTAIISQHKKITNQCKHINIKYEHTKIQYLGAKFILIILILVKYLWGK